MDGAPSSPGTDAGSGIGASKWPTWSEWRVIGVVASALVVGAAVWLFHGERGACDYVDQADVESLVSVPVSDGEGLTDDSRSGASGCGFTTQAGATVSVWIGTERELHNVVETMRANGDVAAGSPAAYVFTLGADGESAVSVTDDGVVLVNAPGHSGAAARLAQLIATRL